MFTNLWSDPSSVRTWPAMPGYSATSLESTSPTVAPSTVATALPPAALRRTVGRRTSTATGPPPWVLTGRGAPPAPAGPRAIRTDKELVGRLLTDLVTILQGGRQGRLGAGAGAEVEV